MGVEARRALDRLRSDGVLDDDALADVHEAITATERAIGSIRLTAAVLRRAGQPMPTRRQNTRRDPSRQAPCFLRSAMRPVSCSARTTAARQQRHARSASMWWAHPRDRRSIRRCSIRPTDTSGSTTDEGVGNATMCLGGTPKNWLMTLECDNAAFMAEVVQETSPHTDAGMVHLLHSSESEPARPQSVPPRRPGHVQSLRQEV